MPDVIKSQDDLDPDCFDTLIVSLKEFFIKKFIFKTIGSKQKTIPNYQACEEY